MGTRTSKNKKDEDNGVNLSAPNINYMRMKKKNIHHLIPSETAP